MKHGRHVLGRQGGVVVHLGTFISFRSFSYYCVQIGRNSVLLPAIFALQNFELRPILRNPAVDEAAFVDFRIVSYHLKHPKSRGA